MNKSGDTFEIVTDVAKTVVVDTIVPTSMSYVISTALFQFVLPYTKNPFQKALAWIGAMSLGYVATTKVDEVADAVKDVANQIHDMNS